MLIAGLASLSPGSVCCKQISPQMRSGQSRAFIQKDSEQRRKQQPRQTGSAPNGEGRGQSVFERRHRIDYATIDRRSYLVWASSGVFLESSSRSIERLALRKQSNFGARNNDSNKWPKNQSQRNKLHHFRIVRTDRRNAAVHVTESSSMFEESSKLKSFSETVGCW